MSEALLLLGNPHCQVVFDWLKRPVQWRNQPQKFFYGARKFRNGEKYLILGEQHYFIWHTASQSAKGR